MDYTQYEGSSVVDNEGNRVGKISEVYIDEETKAPQWGLIHTGLFGSKQTFVPLVGAAQEGGELRVPYDKARITGAPSVEADGELSVEEEAELARYYGLGLSTEASRSGLLTETPQATTGTTVPVATTDTAREGTADAGDTMTRSEEQLRVGTMRRPSELVRLRKTVVTEPVTETVALQHEEVRIEREPITAGTGVADAEIGEQVAEVQLTQEEAVVEKTVVPVEQVHIEKDVTTEERTVTGEVRKEQIEVDRDEPREVRTDRVEVEREPLR